MADEVIAAAASPEDVAAVKALFIEYMNWLGHDLNFQGVDKELETFPKIYSHMLLARVGGVAAGAIALKDLGDDICEMKRLYVPEAFQGTGLGRRLSERLIEDAKAMGFAKMRLDTLPRLEAAVGIYRKLGFREIEPYYFNPIEGVIFFEKDL